MSNVNPDVIVDFVFDRGLLYIVLANIGESPAYAVSVKFDNKIMGLNGNKAISAMLLFQRTEFMPPHKEIRTFLDTSSSYFSSNQPADIKASITFTDREGKKYSNVIKHNLNIYKDIGYIKRGSSDKS